MPVAILISSAIIYGYFRKTTGSGRYRTGRPAPAGIFGGNRMINPMTLLKLGRMKNEFTSRHPRVAAFIRNELLTGVPEDTVFEISMTKPGHDTVTCNMLVTREDLELLQELRLLRENEASNE